MSSGIVGKIAAEVGVSSATVARALQSGIQYRRPSYAARAERIRDLAQHYGYRPNAAAKAMSEGSFNAIGHMHATDMDASFSAPELFRGIHGELDKRNLSLVSSVRSDEELSDDMVVPRLLRELSVDGLLVNYICNPPAQLGALIERHRIPSIWINVKQPFDAVHPDDIAAGRLATEHMLKQGHKRIALGALAISEHYSHFDRIEGYRQAMRDAGLEPMIFEPKLERSIDKFMLSQQWFAQDELPSAVVTVGAGSSIPLATAAVSRGLEIGRDVAFVTMEARPDQSLGLAMSTVVIPHGRVGELAVQELMEKIRHPGAPRPSKKVSPSFARGSTS